MHPEVQKCKVCEKEMLVDIFYIRNIVVEVLMSCKISGVTVSLEDSRGALRRRYGTALHTARIRSTRESGHGDELSHWTIFEENDTFG